MLSPLSRLCSASGTSIVVLIICPQVVTSLSLCAPLSVVVTSSLSSAPPVGRPSVSMTTAPLTNLDRTLSLSLSAPPVRSLLALGLPSWRLVSLLLKLTASFRLSFITPFRLFPKSCARNMPCNGVLPGGFPRLLPRLV